MHDDSKLKNHRVLLIAMFAAAILFVPLASTRVVASNELLRNGFAQRDHLTEIESDRVREAREIVRRIDVYIVIVERRMLALSDPQAATSRQVVRDAERWGELQTGTPLELLTDMARTLDEAITNIEDAATRPGAVPEQGRRALQKLSEASTGFLARLTPMRTNFSEESPEREQLERTVERAQEIIAAANRTGQSTSD